GCEQVGIDTTGAANHAGAVRALVARRVGKMLAGIAPIPLHLRPNEALERAAARAGHVKEALVRTLEPRLDLRLPFDRRRRNEDDLPVVEVRCALHREL